MHELDMDVSFLVSARSSGASYTPRTLYTYCVNWTPSTYQITCLAIIFTYIHPLESKTGWLGMAKGTNTHVLSPRRRSVNGKSFGL